MKLSKKAIYIIVALIIIIGIITFIVKGKPRLKETLPEITLGETKILVGETTVKELYKQGFEISVQTDNTYTTYDDNTTYEMKKNTWNPNASLKRDSHNYATLVLVNNSNKDKNIGESVVYEIDFTRLGIIQGDFKINGIDILNSSWEELENTFTQNGAICGKDGIYYNDGKYGLQITRQDDNIKNILVTCEFNKKF